MTTALGVPVGFGRPGHRHETGKGRDGRCRRRTGSRDSGAVTVEAAVSLLALVVVLVALVWCLGLVMAQLSLGEAARAAARVAARGESAPSISEEAHRLVPDSGVAVELDGGHVLVELQRSVRPPGPMGRWGAVTLRARAVAALEPAS